MNDKLIDYGKIWKAVIMDDKTSFVCFSNGTCVIFTKPCKDLKKESIELLRELGPVHVGSPAGDFSVIHLKGHPGWVVTSQHPDIITYVSPEEDFGESDDDVTIGLYGRDKRNKDSSELKIVFHKEYQIKTS